MIHPVNRRIVAEVAEPASHTMEGSTGRSEPSKAVQVLRWVGGLVLLGGLTASVAWGLRHYALTSPRFRVTEIVVEGNTRLSREDVLQRAGVKMGDNVFALDLEASRAKLLGNAWIAEAHWFRRLPGTIEFRVEERKPSALLSLGELFLVTEKGAIFKKVELGDPTDLPVITGLGDADTLRDRSGLEETVHHAMELAGEYDVNPLAQRFQLQEIHVGADGRMDLVVGKQGLRIDLGRAPYHRKLEEARRAVLEAEKRGGTAEALFVDNEAHPERAIVRMK